MPLCFAPFQAITFVSMPDGLLFDEQPVYGQQSDECYEEHHRLQQACGYSLCQNEAYYYYNEDEYVIS